MDARLLSDETAPRLDTAPEVLPTVCSKVKAEPIDDEPGFSVPSDVPRRFTMRIPSLGLVLAATRRRGLAVGVTVAALAFATPVVAQPAPAGEAVFGWPITIAPTWFDPSTAPPQITPFGILFALHDALVRPLPESEDGPEPGGVLDGERGRAHLRVQAASRDQVPQWRSAHRRGREV